MPLDYRMTRKRNIKPLALMAKSTSEHHSQLLQWLIKHGI